MYESIDTLSRCGCARRCIGIRRTRRHRSWLYWKYIDLVVPTVNVLWR